MGDSRSGNRAPLASCNLHYLVVKSCANEPIREHVTGQNVIGLTFAYIIDTRNLPTHRLTNNCILETLNKHKLRAKICLWCTGAMGWSDPISPKSGSIVTLSLLVRSTERSSGATLRI